MDEAYRLIFKVDENGAELASMERVEMRLPAGEGPADDEEGLEAVGHFVELRDTAGEAIYRQAVESPTARRVEYPTGDPEQPFGRAELAAPAAVAVLVPATPEGRSVALVEAMGRAAQDDAEGVEASAAAPVRRDLISVALPQGESGDGD